MFPLALIVYLSSRKIILDVKYKYVLYAGGIMMIITELLTLAEDTIRYNRLNNNNSFNDILFV